MTSFLTIDTVSRLFGPNLTLGEKIAARLGANVETRSVRAVSNVSLTIRKGETLGLVGESGCGKSTLGRLIAGILSPTTGTVILDGGPVMEGGTKVTTRVQTVFQDPFYTKLRPDLAVKKADGETVWRDYKGLSFIDVGANLGIYGFLARSVGASALLVEPEPCHFQFLSPHTQLVPTISLPQQLDPPHHFD